MNTVDLSQENKKLFQETFDKIAIALIEQGQQSKSEYLSCAYRGIDGCKCAIGHLIPDEEYNNLIEGKNVRFLRYDFPIAALKPFFFAEGERFLNRLQSAHDHANCSKTGGRDEVFITSIKDRLRQVASTFDLDASVLKQ